MTTLGNIAKKMEDDLKKGNVGGIDRSFGKDDD